MSSQQTKSVDKNDRQTSHGNSLPENYLDKASTPGTLNDPIAEHKSFWLDRLKRVRVTQEGLLETAHWVSTKWETSHLSDASLSLEHSVYPLAIWLLYLARLTNDEMVQLGFGISKNKTEAALPTAARTLTVPMEIAIDLDGCFSDLMSAVINEFAAIQRHIPYAEAIFSHENLIAKTHDQAVTPPWQFAALVDEQAADEIEKPKDEFAIENLTHGSVVTFHISNRGSSFRWLYDASKIDVTQVNRMTTHIKALNRTAITSDRKNDGATGEHNESSAHRNRSCASGTHNQPDCIQSWPVFIVLETPRGLRIVDEPHAGTTQAHRPYRRRHLDA